jgi:hypothetical protein
MRRLQNQPSTRRASQLAARGLTLDQISARLGMHRSSCYRRLRAANVPRSWEPLTEQERDVIVRLINLDQPRRIVAAAVSRSLGTVARVALSLQQFDEHKTTRAYRCYGCGNYVTVTPCVICEALAASDRHSLRDERIHAPASEAAGDQSTAPAGVGDLPGIRREVETGEGSTTGGQSAVCGVRAAGPDDGGQRG